ncbi:hypothetical protein H5410_064850, partial [Solanum commersonii]
ALLFFALVGISGCFLTYFDESVHDDLSQPCENALSCCSCTSLCADCHTRRPHTGTTYICIDTNLCCDNCSNWTCECCSENHSCTDCECGSCLGGGGDQSGIPGLFVVAVIVIGLFALLGMCFGCYNGRTENLAATLPHTREKNADKGICCGGRW